MFEHIKEYKILNFDRVRKKLNNISSIHMKVDNEYLNSEQFFDVEQSKRILLLTLIEAIAQITYNSEENCQENFTKLIIEKSNNLEFKKISIPTLCDQRYSSTKNQQYINGLNLNQKIAEFKNRVSNPKTNYWQPLDDVDIPENKLIPIGYRFTYAWAFYDYRSKLVHAHQGGCGLSYDKISYVTASEAEKYYLTVSSSILTTLIEKILGTLEQEQNKEAHPITC